jgi:hypothetical protein
MDNLQNKRSRSADKIPSRSRTPAGHRVEDHLLIRYEHSKKKLMNLKEERINEEMQHMRSKPEISKKSRQLARKAEKRFYEQYKNMMNEEIKKLFENIQTPVEEPVKPKVVLEDAPLKRSAKLQVKQAVMKPGGAKPQAVTFGKHERQEIQEQQQMGTFNTDSSEKIANQQTAYFASEPTPKSRPQKSSIIASPAGLSNKSYFSVLNTTEDSIDEPQNESLYHMSAIQRNEIWEQKRRKKLIQKTQATVEDAMKKCTFTPIFYSRLPHKLHKLPAEDLLSISTQHTEDPCPQSDRSFARGRSLSPYTRVVGFSSGFDVSRFMKRAKPVEPII